MKTYWQIAAGNGEVDLEELFLKLNVALIGPGRLGEYFENRTTYDQLPDGHLVKKFASEVQVGDVLVLKRLVNPHT
ncbi:hypothetical protein [Exiguobacterium aurantiacum]|uniref:hypothetical protein n=1 Tax=Exiguobacterium aurantiacum TaxID=33987 RepID=UPI0009F2D4B4|nr:hypothetical protein [Exiguobacterium aurantiacum]